MKRENLEKILKGLDLMRESIISELESMEKLNSSQSTINNKIDSREESDFIDNDKKKSIAYLKSLTLNELKDIARKLEISIRGSKAVIIDKLIDAKDSLEELYRFELEGSEARIEAVKNRFLELMEQVNDGEITKNEIIEFFEIYFEDNKLRLINIFNMSDEDLSKHYCWIQANLIDDKGEEVEFEVPYTVGKTEYCCGIPMKKIDDTSYFCEIDGMELDLSIEFQELCRGLDEIEGYEPEELIDMIMGNKN